ncbi:MAG: DUF4418 family protein [Atopobiaceae bacterium]|nr:DUF4418 family protein [Atopobiaceae bacterium]
MQKRNAFPIAAYALVALSALLAVGVLTFAGPCVHDDGTVGACYGASRVLVGLGACAFVASVVRVLVSNVTVQRVLTALVLVVGAAAAILPGNVVPLCMMSAMRCNAIMHPFGIAVGAGMVLASAADLVLSARSKDVR